jgi:hypothetical protein
MILLIIFCSPLKEKNDTIIWDINNLKYIGGNKVTILSSPKVLNTLIGRATQFDGIDDGLILNTNPLAGAKVYTVEIIFRPDSGGNPEQRFFHMGEIDGNRVLMETRLTDNNMWFLDTYIRSGESERTLYAKNFLHPTGKWYHAALVYDGKKVRHFVNGSLELEGLVGFVPMEGGRTSIGCRLNQVFWYKGAIRRIRITPRVLSPKEFLPIENN